MNKIILLFSVIGLLSFQACKDKNPVVLSINGDELRKDRFITMLELEKSKVETQEKRTFNKKRFRSWIDHIIENKLIEQVLEKNGYADDPEILYQASVIDKAILSQQNGEFYQEIIDKKVKVQPDQVADGMKYFSWDFTFELLCFDSQKQMTDVLQTDSTQLSEEAFNTLAQRADELSISHDTIVSMWPFDALLGNRTQLQAMKAGEITKPLRSFDHPYEMKYFVAKLISRERNPKINEADIKSEYIGHLMYMYNSTLAFNKKLHSYYDSSAYTMDRKLIEDVYALLEYDEETGNIDTAKLHTLLGKTAITYQFDGQTKDVSISNFIKFYHTLPMRRKFSSLSDFREYFQDMICFDYMWKEAEDMGYVTTDEYLLKRKGMRNRMATTKFYDDSLFASIAVAENEIEDRYAKDITQYTFPENYQYDLLLFKTYPDAFTARDTIAKLETTKELSYTDTAVFKNIVEVQQGLSIRIDSLKKTNNRQLSSIIRSTCSDVFQEGKFFAIALKKRESGEYTVPLTDMNDNIKNRIMNEKAETIKNNYIAELKSKAVISEDLQFEDYFN